MRSLFPPILRSAMVGAPRLFSRLYAIEDLLARIPPPARVLEVGPGLGDLTAHLLERYPQARFTLAEISAGAADALRARFAGEARVEVSQSDLLAKGHIEPGYDLSIACEVFEHVEDDLAGLREMAALTHSGGYFIFSAPCHMSKWQTSDALVGHYRRYERKELVEKLLAAGFAIEELWTFGFPSVNLLQPLREVYYRVRKAAGTTDRQTATEKSGIDRPRVMGYAKWPLIALLSPILLLESLFWRKELGDGFLVLARRR